jgi:hypothetical protein
VLTPERLTQMIDVYYARRGLDPEGRPLPATEADLGLNLFGPGLPGNNL